jgi:hypothetical protein
VLVLRFNDERGITPIIGAILIITIVGIAMSVYLGQVVPQHLRMNETAHMYEIRAAFLKLQGMILSRESGEIEIPMSPEPAPIFTLPPQSSQIEVRPASWVKRFQPIDDAYVSEVEPDTPHDGEVLNVASYSDGDNWAYLKFDILNELQGVDAEDVAEAWLVLYCENISKFKAAPWEMQEYRWPPDNTEQMDLFHAPDIPIIVEIYRVEDTTWTESTLTWANKPTPGKSIKATAWPNEDNHTIKMGEVWYTWEVTTWVKDRMEAGQNVSLCLRPAYGGSSLERYANFTSREGGGVGVVNIFGVSDLNNNGVIDENEVEEEDREEKVTGHPPYPKPHLVVIYENGEEIPPPLLDNWGAFVDGGYVRFDAEYYQFPEHSFVFELGALFQQQYGFAYEFMISDPGLVVGEHIEDDDNIVVILNRYRIVSWDHITTSSDVVLRVEVRENSVRELHLENIVITIRSGFEWPWKRYLRDLTGNWNRSARKGGLQWMVDYYGDHDGDPEYGDPWSNNTVDPMVVKQVVGRNLRLYVWGRVEDPSVKDIYYYDRTYDVEVTIGVV